MTARSRPLSPFLLLVAGVSWTLGSAPGRAQTAPVAPVSESVVVTATASPEAERQIGSATTVITRERIVESGFPSVAELLRAVPGLDLVRSGSDGAVTFAEIRGANSTQTLVLVDGQRLNSPYFPGYDLSTLTTENVDRIEIVRGPFSALYGSDAIGGVIQIFTRRPATGFSGNAALEAGSDGQRGGTVFGSYGAGPWGLAASFGDVRVGGDRRNSDWEQKNGSVRLDGKVGEDLHLGVEGAFGDAALGVPGPVGAETPHARYAVREERIAFPLSFRPAEGHEATVLLSDIVSEPSYEDPDSGFSSQTRARSIQARAGDAWTSGPNRLTGFVSWERGRVDDRSNFGVNLDGQQTTIWGAGLEDTLRMPAGFTATVGLRHDHHSQFGGAWSPRSTLSWLSSDSLWKLRVSGGSAFRAPTVGELYDPFSGNPALKPERSTSWELGAERYLPSGRLEASLFWNDYRDLIVYDFSRFQNFNVGRARARGVELAWTQDLVRFVSLDVGYTYLDARDELSGQPLIRRPRHRGFLELDLHPLEALAISPRAVFVGSRADRDALTGAPVENPSYVRFDLNTRYTLARLAPYLRVENLMDRGYEEVAGYPAPRRRIAGGLEVRF